MPQQSLDLLFVWRWRHQLHSDGVNLEKNPTLVRWCVVQSPPTTTWHRSINSHHHRPPSSLLCLCICCSLQGRCSYEGEAAGRYSPPPTHTFPPSPLYDYLSMYPSARITPHPPPQPAQSEHSHLSPQAAPLYELHWPSSPDNYNG